MMTLGAQLFTVREKTANLTDLAETLARVADIGYREVQLSGICAYEPDWMAEQLKKNGLTVPVVHFAADQIRDNPERVAKDHAVFGCKRIGLGMCPGWMTDDTFDGFVRDFAPAAERLKAVGAKLYYHNHWHEFMRSESGERFMDKLCARFPADDLGIILDTYWVQYAGGDPAAWIRKLAGRVDCIHVKDSMPIGDTPAMMPVGEGNMNWEHILAAAEAAGTEHLLVEQDNCNGENPFDCLARSYRYLTDLLK